MLYILYHLKGAGVEDEDHDDAEDGSPEKTKGDADGKKDGKGGNSGPVVAPLLPLGDRILPDRWLNIPSCLVNAFREDIANHEYLERVCQSVSERMQAVEDKMRNQKKMFAVMIDKSAVEVRGDTTRAVLALETKLKSSITEVRLNVAKAVESIEEGDARVLEVQNGVQRILQTMETTAGAQATADALTSKIEEGLQATTENMLEL